jgi:hypothetical protein
MKVFAIISLCLSGLLTLVFGGHAVKCWFKRKEDDFAGGVLLTVFCIVWLLTAIFLLRG